MLRSEEPVEPVVNLSVFGPDALMLWVSNNASGSAVLDREQAHLLAVALVQFVKGGPIDG